MSSVRVYLIVNGRGDCRLNRRRPALAFDEVAYTITVQVPQGWARVYDGPDLTLPEPGELGITVGSPESDAAEVDA